MSPLNFGLFRSVPSKIKLNGPYVRFVDLPNDATEDSNNFVTFEASAVAEYAGGGANPNGGYLFKWYIGNTEIKDAEDTNSGSNARIVNFGGTSRLTLTNIDPSYQGKEVYVEVDYVSAIHEGKVVNAPLRSNSSNALSYGYTTSAFRSTDTDTTDTSTEEDNNGDGRAQIITQPRLEIDTQPEDWVGGSGLTAPFDIVVKTIPSDSERISYRWQMGGKDLVDGLINDSEEIEKYGVIGNVTSGTKFTVQSDDGSESFEIDWAERSSFSEFTPGKTYSVVSNNDVTTKVVLQGGGGSVSDFRPVRGSSGGSLSSKVTFLKGQTYVLQVGSAGKVGSGGFPGGGSVGVGTMQIYSGGGGGYSGLFLNSVSHSNTIVIAAGGGGSSPNPGVGGDGGVNVALTGSNGTSGEGDNGAEPGQGGTISSGGLGGGNGGNGSALTGGNGDNPGAGGGGGYYGGGGGGKAGPGSGGGGSSYYDSTQVTDGTGQFGVLSDNYGVDGRVIFELVDIVVSNPQINVSGAFTPNLRLYTDSDNIGANVNCYFTADANNSPLISDIVSYQVLAKQPIVVFESIDTIDTNVKTETTNFNKTESFTLNSETFGSTYKLIQFYAKETDFILTMDIKSSAGESVSGNSGGEGGTSKIKLSVKKDFEYTILGISNNSSVFIYEKSRLIAVIGQGGGAGVLGNGGDGGGVNVDGRTGGGTNPGIGGERPVSGTLTTNGTYGSILQGSNLQVYPEDSMSNVPDGGRTVSCSKGLYWINRGKSPCEDISDSGIQFVDQNGVTYSQSSSLLRGFKAGYSITDTSGRNVDRRSGKGGNGATGGQGGVAGAGGGGGSGYADAEVVVVSTTSGGNSDLLSSIVFSID
jgi:hypothetical protein